MLNKNMQHHSPANEKVDFLILAIIISLMVVVTYHSFYFGDELIPWLVLERHDNFLGALSEYSGYKPRLIFNSLWITFSFFELSRFVPAAIFAISQFVTAALIYKIISNICQDRLLSWLAVLAFLTNRFGIAIWYDYLSGIIESLSLCFFLAGLYLLHHERAEKYKIISSFVLFVCCVLVHERYIAGIFVSVILSALLVDSLKPYRLHLFLASLFPALVFFLLNQTLGQNSIAMGTSGQEVGLGLKTLLSFITYLGNIFFHINYGKPWFFGALTIDSELGLKISTISALIFAIVYFTGLLYKNRQINPKKAIIYFGCIVAFVAVASLPGTDRQEARWIHPVAAMMLFLYASSFSKPTFLKLLLLLISINCFYFFSGALNGVANVTSSKIAQTLGITLTSGTLLGNKGIIIGGGNGTSWAIGGGSALGNDTYDGKLFTKANAINNKQVFLQPEGDNYIDGSFDFALIFSSERNAHQAFMFKQHSISYARTLLSPDTLSSNEKIILGKQGKWDSWIFANKQHVKGDLLLAKNFDGFFEIDASKLNNNFLIYTAKKIDDRKTTMRIQVNWMDENNQFINAFIKVVELKKESEIFSESIIAPQTAKKGLVYATLHGDSVGEAILESVEIGVTEYLK